MHKQISAITLIYVLLFATFIAAAPLESYSGKHNGKRNITSSNGNENDGNISGNFGIENYNGTYDGILNNGSYNESIKSRHYNCLNERDYNDYNEGYNDASMLTIVMEIIKDLIVLWRHNY
ncbi:13836_t:CDS:1 [Ambispora leptoticha]|uniref:13836_t:CDS:1 n=1 Tax=Ambispora leptoticha TaxID=144679 RepID=A0A9N9AG25_9GLOM|nr:13836_t:CDS:1 [Ambispora leptoticha]